MQQQSPIGNLFGPSPSTTEAVPAQPNSDGHQAAGQNPGSSKPDISTQSADESGSSESESNDQSSEGSTSQQNPTSGNPPSASTSGQSSDSQEPSAGSGGDHSTGSDDQTASKGELPIGAASNNGATSSNGGASGNDGGGPKNEGAPNHGSGSSNGDLSSNGGAWNGGDSMNSEGGASKNGGISNNGHASIQEEGSISGGTPQSETGSSTDSHGTQYVPSIVMVGNLPVFIVSDGVIVGSQTVEAGSVPTTFVANGQTVAIQPSRIVIQSKTISIQAVVTPPPAGSAKIGNVAVILQPQGVAIGSKTYLRGSSPTSITYNGRIYSWDASQLVGAGATVAFPSADPTVPLVTAGGCVFSVYPSQLKASGRIIPLPTTAKASPFIYQGRTFSINPSQIIAPNASITLPLANKATPFIYVDHSLSVDVSHFMGRSTTIALSSGSGTITYNGQVLTVKPSEVIGPSTTIALSAPGGNGGSPTVVTTGGLTFAIGPSAAVLGSSTYSFIPGKTPATIMTHGEAVLVGSNGVQFGNIHVPIPTGSPSFSAVSQGDLTFSVAPSVVVLGGHTDSIKADMAPITTVIDGHTISIGPKGVGLASTTIALPSPKPSFSLATEGGLTFSVAPSEVVVRSKTFSITPKEAPVTTSIDGQIMTIGPKGIHLQGATLGLPVIQTSTDVTAGGLTFLVGATDAVISDTTYAIGSGAPLQTIVVGSQSIQLGSAGVMLPSTTIPPKQTPTVVIADGLTFSADPTEAVINGTTYAVGSGAMAQTVLVGSKTMILGTDGVVLPSTTIRPWSSAEQAGFSSALEPSNASSAVTATEALTPIATGKGSEQKHAAGVSTRIPDRSTLLGFVLGVLMVGLKWR